MYAVAYLGGGALGDGPPFGSQKFVFNLVFMLQLVYGPSLWILEMILTPDYIPFFPKK